MAIQHGNKTYLQILLDPNRARLLLDLAEAQNVRPTAWIRDLIYKQLELCVSSETYQQALDADKKAWEDSIARRVKGRVRPKKETTES